MFFYPLRCNFSVSCEEEYQQFSNSLLYWTGILQTRLESIMFFVNSECLMHTLSYNDKSVTNLGSSCLNTFNGNHCLTLQTGFPVELYINKTWASYRILILSNKLNLTDLHYIHVNTLLYCTCVICDWTSRGITHVRYEQQCFRCTMETVIGRH